MSEAKPLSRQDLGRRETLNIIKKIAPIIKENYGDFLQVGPAKWGFPWVDEWGREWSFTIQIAMPIGERGGPAYDVYEAHEEHKENIKNKKGSYKK